MVDETSHTMHRQLYKRENDCCRGENFRKTFVKPPLHYFKRIEGGYGRVGVGSFLGNGVGRKLRK